AIGGWRALAATLVVGMAAELFAIRKLYGRDHLDHVLGTFGLILFFNELVRLVWGPAGMNLPLPPYLGGAVEILPGVYYPAYRIAVIARGLMIAVLVYLRGVRPLVGLLIC